MTKVFSLAHIRTILGSITPLHLLETIESGFVAYSIGKVVTPPVGHMALAKPPADIHVKYGYIEGDDYYVLKVASSFYDNPKLGISSSNGVMLVFCRTTGQLRSVLLDEGNLTDVRTALAGAIAAKYLAPVNVKAIGILGTGVQARMQLYYLRYITSCRKVFVYGRSKQSMRSYMSDMSKLGFNINEAKSVQMLAAKCNLINYDYPFALPTYNG